MLEKPDLPDRLILDRLEAEFGLRAERLNFLPLGADVNTAVYRVTAAAGTPHFLKLRKGAFAGVSAALPHFLARQGIRQVIAPLETVSGALWGRLEPYVMLLYPYVEGENGYEAALSDRQWLEFGAALAGIHAARLPPALLERIPRESFSDVTREQVRLFQARSEVDRYFDPVAVRTAALMRAKRAEITRMAVRADRLAQDLRARPPEFVLCHGDMHAGNLLICPDGGLYIVDWDAPLLAPKEKDLSLIGGCSTWGNERDGRLFYKGYGPARIHPTALAYYRYERILLDVVAYCEQLLLSAEGGEDREQSYRYFSGQFEPGQEVDLALRTDPGH